ncbi:M90 family metallopeptidase [Marinobacter zhejiangensis]|uniref:Zinc-dependent peptidase n=1 Tax=Marinobacter zhejiangensis TaxID=488535 RepID=A0A1I4LWQ8_9GAMM|nr:M90 family metallopeptidase [Marinobacter zhejiangensis]SFL95638.1 hypothetical protein SAMN04487963_0723 [Marinobacter zhejiangensis]
MLGYGLALIAIVVFAFYWLFIRPRRRLESLARIPVPMDWIEQLRSEMALYRRLPPITRTRLHTHMRVLLEQVDFYGCAGLELTEPMKVLIAAHGALLINQLSPDYYHKLQSILVYPGAYRVNQTQQDGPVLHDHDQARLGESWQTGKLVLAWDTLVREAADDNSRSNVALHEFAHQLDQVDGASDGAPPLASGEIARHWQDVFSDAWQRRRQRHGGNSIIDEYGATSPAEFFAVATEAFFLHPGLLAKQEPDLYDCLAGFYRLDPGTWSDLVSTT